MVVVNGDGCNDWQKWTLDSGGDSQPRRLQRRQQQDSRDMAMLLMLTNVSHLNVRTWRRRRPLRLQLLLQRTMTFDVDLT